ncbi:MAG: MlaD family protein [Campylobacterota bacterium]|nr:MlaD family protein [Campylobacterota bacterium]
MYSRVNYTIVGIFVMLFTAGVIFFAFWLGNTGLSQDYNLYTLRMKESVSGLSKDSGVKMKGVDIGSVRDIRINPDNIEEVDIVLTIKKGTVIKEDMLGVIKMYGLTGLSYIEIEGGTNGARTLDPDSGKAPVIKAGQSLMGKLGDNLEALSEKLVIVLDRGEKVLSEENLKHFSSILEHVDKVAAKGIDLEDKTIAALDEAESALKEFRASFKKMSANFDLLASDLHDGLVPSINRFKKMADSVESVATTIEASVNRGDYNMQKIMKPTLIDIRSLSEQIDALADQMRESPNDLIFKSSTPRKGPGE